MNLARVNVNIRYSDVKKSLSSGQGAVYPHRLLSVFNSPNRILFGVQEIELPPVIISDDVNRTLSRQWSTDVEPPPEQPFRQNRFAYLTVLLPEIWQCRNQEVPSVRDFLDLFEASIRPKSQHAKKDSHKLIHFKCRKWCVRHIEHCQNEYRNRLSQKMPE